MNKRADLILAIIVIIVAIAVSSTVLAATSIVTASNTQDWFLDGTTISFNNGEASVGSGSLEFGPIGVSEKFIAIYPSTTFTGGADLGIQANSATYAFDYFMSADATSNTGLSNFYLNVYVDVASNGIRTYASFYDCRYDFIPNTGNTLNSWVSSGTINGATTPYVVGNAIGTCPATMSGLAATDIVRYIALNGGQSTDTDVNLTGRYDNVQINGDIFDFEASLPVVINEETGEAIILPTFYDGRMNDFDGAAPVALFPIEYGADGMGIHIYDVTADSQGILGLVVTPEEIAAVPVNPEVNTVIAEGATTLNYVIVSRLTDGNFQININQPNGKTYIIIFSNFDGSDYISFETP